MLGGGGVQCVGDIRTPAFSERAGERLVVSPRRQRLGAIEFDFSSYPFEPKVEPSIVDGLTGEAPMGCNEVRVTFGPARNGSLFVDYHHMGMGFGVCAHFPQHARRIRKKFVPTAIHRRGQ